MCALPQARIGLGAQPEDAPVAFVSHVRRLARSWRASLLVTRHEGEVSRAVGAPARRLRATVLRRE
jgi:hypothetical protein